MDPRAYVTHDDPSCQKGYGTRQRQVATIQFTPLTAASRRDKRLDQYTTKTQFPSPEKPMKHFGLLLKLRRYPHTRQNANFPQGKLMVFT